MRHALPLVAALASLTATAAPVTTQRPAAAWIDSTADRPPVAAVCRGDALPFSLALVEFCDDCGDLELEQLAAAAWAEVCAPANQRRDPYARAVCACVPPARRY